MANKKGTRVLISKSIKNLAKSKPQNSSQKFGILGSRNLIISRRSQIASGISWFVAFIIIFFIMFLFVSASLVIFKAKKISVVEIVAKELGIIGFSGVDYERGNLIETESLIAILNTKIGDCFWLRNPSLEGDRWKDAVQKYNFKDISYIDLTRIFIEANPSYDISGDYLFHILQPATVGARPENLKEVFQNKEQPYDIFAQIFARCLSDDLFGDRNMNQQIFVIEFSNGKLMYFWTGGVLNYNTILPRYAVYLPSDDKITTIIKIPPSEGLFNYKGIVTK